MPDHRPCFQFYPGDWLKDPALRRCSHAGRGLAIDLLCLMFECPERGVLAGAGGPWTDDEIVRCLGGQSGDTLGTLQEVVRYGVFSRRDDGALVSRRMVKDETQRKAWAEKKRNQRGVSPLSHDCPRTCLDFVPQLSPLSSSSPSGYKNPPTPRKRGDEAAPGKRKTRAELKSEQQEAERERKRKRDEQLDAEDKLFRQQVAERERVAAERRAAAAAGPGRGDGPAGGVPHPG